MLTLKQASFLVSHKTVLIRIELRSVMVLSMVSLQSVLCAASTDPHVKRVCSSGRAEETAQS